MNTKSFVSFIMTIGKFCALAPAIISERSLTSFLEPNSARNHYMSDVLFGPEKVPVVVSDICTSFLVRVMKTR